MMSRIISIVLLACVLIGCIASIAIAAAVPASVVITKEPGAPLVAKKTFQFVAKVYDANSAVIKGAKVLWSCSNPLAGSISSKGKFTAGIKAGEAAIITVKVSANQLLADTSNITITNAAASKLVVTPSSLDMKCGEEATLSANVTDAYGNLIEENVNAVWTSKSAKAGAFAANKFTAGSVPGKYSKAISASYSGLKASVNVTVGLDLSTTDVILTRNSIDVTGSTLEVMAGEVQKFTAKAKDKLGREIGGLKFKYSVADTTGDIGNVSQSGVLSTKKQSGSAGVVSAQIISKSTLIGEVASVNIAIVPAAPKTVTLSPTSVVVGPQESATLAVSEVKDKWGNVITDFIVTQWAVSLPAAGAITAGGVFTSGTVAGTYKATATVTNDFGSAAGSASIIVLAQTAEMKLKTLLDAGSTELDPKPLYDWFSAYLKVDPTNPAGILGYNITRLGATVNKYNGKYDALLSLAGVDFTFQSALNWIVDNKTQSSVLNTLTGSNPAFISLNSAALKSADLSPDTIKSIISDMRNNIIPLIDSSIAGLAPVIATDGVIMSWTDSGNVTYNLRSEDVIAYRASLEATNGVLKTVFAYNWDPGLSFLMTLVSGDLDDNGNGYIEPGEYLLSSSFMKLSSASLMDAGFVSINAAVTDARTVTDAMLLAEDPDELLLHFAIDWADVSAKITTLNDTLAGPTVIDMPYYDSQLAQDTTIPVTVDLGALWRNKPNLRTLAPTLQITQDGFSIYNLPDKTLGGVFPKADEEISTEVWDYWLP